MQPQDTSSPTPQYDFILNEQKQPAQSRLNFLKNIPKPALIMLGLGIVFIAVLLAVALSDRSSTEPQPLIRAAGRAQEISRISGLVQTQSKDPDTQSLAATAKLVMASESSRLSEAIRQSGSEILDNALTAYQNKDTDEQLTEAQRENGLEEAYWAYLKDSLSAYRTELAAAGNSNLAQSAINNADTLLSAPQLTGLKN